jgi:hypothetical protein
MQLCFCFHLTLFDITPPSEIPGRDRVCMQPFPCCNSACVLVVSLASRCRVCNSMNEAEMSPWAFLFSVLGVRSRGDRKCASKKPGISMPDCLNGLVAALMSQVAGKLEKAHALYLRAQGQRSHFLPCAVSSMSHPIALCAMQHRDGLPLSPSVPEEDHNWIPQH